HRANRKKPKIRKALKTPSTVSRALRVPAVVSVVRKVTASVVLKDKVRARARNPAAPVLVPRPTETAVPVTVPMVTAATVLARRTAVPLHAVRVTRRPDAFRRGLWTTQPRTSFTAAAQSVAGFTFDAIRQTAYIAGAAGNQPG